MTNWNLFLQEWARGIKRDPQQLFSPRTKRHCPICDFHGRFINAGDRQEVRCPSCASKERDRMVWLSLRRAGFKSEGKNILHFSAERPFFHRWRRHAGYVAGDIKKSKVANAVVDITNIQFADGHFDLVICHHVLEHVPDDKKGIAECYRVMKKGGTGYISVPMQVGAPATWNPPAGMPREEVDRICGWDHLRLYGEDFAGLLKNAGFQVEEVTFTPQDTHDCRLSDLTEEKLYIVRK